MTTFVTFNMTAFKQAITQSLTKHHKLYFFEGLFFVVLGFMCVLMPYIAAEIMMMVLGFTIFTAGLIQAYFNYKGGRRHWGFYISALMSTGFGLAILFWPEQGAIALATLIALFLVMKGFSEIFVAGAMAPAKGWSLALLSGIVTLLISAIIWAGWPMTSVWFLGIAIGLNFAMFGISTMNIAQNYKNNLKED